MKLREEISQLKEENSHLKQMVNFDLKTGFLSENRLKEDCAKVWHRALREHKSLVLMVGDIDSFKLVNDCLGHQQGDCLLRLFGQIVGQTVRSDETIYRLGSAADEFLILAVNGRDDVSLEAMMARIKAQAKRVFESFKLSLNQESPEVQKFLDKEQGYPLGVSVGLAYVDPGARVAGYKTSQQDGVEIILDPDQKEIVALHDLQVWADKAMLVDKKASRRTNSFYR